MDENTLTSSVDLSSALRNAQETRVREHEKAIDVAKKFEALLLFTMMKSMRSSLSEDTLTGSDQQDTYREMMDREIAETIAQAGGLGLQKMLENQLSPKSESNNLNSDSSSATVKIERAENYGPVINKAAIALDHLTRHRLSQVSQTD